VDIAAALKAFAAIFPAELPDKTMIATVVLVTHHRRALPVWCGAAAAFAVHVTLAVVAGQFLQLLPSTAVSLLMAALFVVGAVVLWRESAEDDDEDEGEVAEDGVGVGGGEGIGEAGGASGPDGVSQPGEGERAAGGVQGGAASSSAVAFGASFGVVMVAEAGDLTQLATAGLAAGSSAPWSVAVGALAALWLVAALAAGVGQRLTAWLPVRHLQRGAAVVFAVLAVAAVVAAIG
jgi:Ca2+/H+ antiporter, TMEM165/GDT1 family